LVRIVRTQDGVTTIYAASGGASDKTTVTVDRLLNESFEDDAETLLSNGWFYNDSGNGGDAEINHESNVGVTAVAGTRLASVNGDGGTSPGPRAIETNYTLETSRYDSLTLTYVAIDDGAADELDESLRAQYQASDGSWVTIDEITPVGYDGRYFHRRATIDGVANASHNDFKLRFTQGETSGAATWRLDTVDLVGVNESVESDLNQAPKAHFRYSPDSPTTSDLITFDAARSDDPDDSTITSYDWDFGDGTTDAGKEVQHSYDANGTYAVELNVTDGRGKSVARSQTVSVSGSGGSSANAYITAIEPDPGNDKPPRDAEIEFVRFELPSSPDTSTWEIVEPGDDTQSLPSDLSGTVYFAGDPTVFANQWNGVSGSNVYDLGGITLNNGGDTIVLRDGSGTTRDEFAWGGETTSSGWSFAFSTDGQVANRSYSGGSYDDTDSAGDFSEEAECDFFGGGNGCNTPPTANFTYAPGSPVPNESITFDASSSSDPDGDSLTYDWDFGDGNTTSGQIVSHNYSSSGDYTVNLTVRDGNGGVNSTTETVSVRTNANFQVTIDSTNSPVVEGETLRVNATIENIGERSGTQDIPLTIDGTQEDIENVTIAGGGSATVNHTWTTVTGDAGDYTAEVASTNSSDTSSVTVESSDAGGSASITSATATGGQNSQLQFDVTNTAGYEVTVDGVSVDSYQDTTGGSDDPNRIQDADGGAEIRAAGTDLLDGDFAIGDPEQTLSTNLTISPGQTAQFTLDEFYRTQGGGTPVNISDGGEQIGITLYFSDGTSASTTLSPA
jgi:PKD repeat protein